MISIIITSFNEPDTIGRTIESIISQKIKYNYELIISCPDKETAKVVSDYAKKNKRIRRYKDPGKGKSFALNLLFKEAKGDILVFTDGDLYLGENSINELLEPFKDKKVGIVTGRVMSMNSKNNMLGYWSHFLMDVGAHKISREKRADKDQFIECSAYLFAFRGGVIKEIPLDVAEDAIIPYMFWKKGYKIAYAPNALVYVKWPDSFKEWLSQKKRAASAHENLNKYYLDFPRVKSFYGEAIVGGIKNFKEILKYPNSFKEYFWTFTLFPARLWMWLHMFYDIKFKNKGFSDGWARVESTK
jgi:cellulose synthase/poly-beta-1,6-N-acetylglucosamine synthase-like glycosyltransferase